MWGDSRSKDVWSNLADVLSEILKEVVLAQKSSSGIDFAEICFSPTRPGVIPDKFFR